MFKNIFSKFIILFCFILVVLFSFSNPGDVSLGIWPLNDRVEVPIYFLVIFSFTIGFFIGGLYKLFKSLSH